MNNKMKIFSGTSNLKLSKMICSYLGVELSKSKVSSFSDGECRIKILENARGTDVFIIQSTAPPVNHNIMELLIMIDALKRASAKRITAVIPYYGYARQDRKDSPRVPITAKLVANVLQVAGEDRILSVDIQSQLIQGFFDCPLDNILALPVVIEYLEKNKIKDLTVVAPDTGGVERARELAKRIDADIVVIDKRRPEPNVAKIYNVIGDVKGKNAVIVDDMVDTAGTLAEISQALMENGAKGVYGLCTHGVLSGDAVEKIRKSSIKELITTDTIPMDDNKNKVNKIKVLSIAELLGEAIKRIHEETSVSDLFV
ncbi:MAG: ribose-phosphate pyrophosphokinase [Elusimicrobia bacterium]|jgi:ribose-phosphate pyrophosphokinase|nr:ribose-phosphate pyrophosphokinase [Elusimicrobiota bacterium]